MTDQRVIKSYVWHDEKCFFVSTIERDSSAMEGPERYNETMVWLYDWKKAERNKNYIYQDGAPAGTIAQHIAVCERIYATGNPEE